MKKLSTVISVLLHPIFLPSLFLGLLLISSYYMNAFLRPEAYRVLFLTLLVFTVFIPLLIISIAKMTGIIDSYTLKKRSERIFALIITGLSTYFAWRMFARFDLPAFYSLYLLSFIGVLVLSFVISFFYKISLHLVGWGAFIALIIVYLLRFELDLILYLVPVFLLSGAAAWARLEQKAHSQAQVYAGFGVGLLALFSYFF